MEHGPLLEGFPLIKGVICGSLLAGSLISLYGLAVQIFFLAIAALIFLDSLFVFNREPHLISFLVFVAIGAVLAFSALAAGLIGLHFLIVFIAMGMIYLYEFMLYRETRSRKKA